MIALDMCPYNIVEYDGFNGLINYLATGYKIPTRTIFSRNQIPVLFYIA